MQRAILTIGAICWLLGLSMGSAQAAPRILDCPLRDTKFSLDLPVIDLFASEQARVVIDRHYPGVTNLPPSVISMKPPTFLAIATLGQLAELIDRPAPDAARINPELAAIPITDAVRAQRCERYDDERPVVAVPRGKKVKVLVFEKVTGFLDKPSLDAAHAAIAAMAERRGWGIAYTDRAGAMRPATLAKFDVVIWNNVSGDVLTLSQRRAFRSFVENGGGFVGLHGAAGDFMYVWDWYRDRLIGAEFIGHTSGKYHFQPARVIVEAGNDGLDAGLPSEWTMTDEWYSFARSPRLDGARVVARLDEGSYKLQGASRQPIAMGADHPIAWAQCIGRGKSFYSAIGHLPDTYSDTDHIRLLENGITWAAMDQRGGCRLPINAAQIKETAAR